MRLITALVVINLSTPALLTSARAEPAATASHAADSESPGADSSPTWEVLMHRAQDQRAHDLDAEAAETLTSAVAAAGSLEELRAVFRLGTGVEASPRLHEALLRSLAFTVRPPATGIQVALDGPDGLECNVHFPEKAISIAVQDADVPDLLGMIESAAGIRITAPGCERLGGPVSLALHDVRAGELLRRILFSQGLGCVEEEGRVTITCASSASPP